MEPSSSPGREEDEEGETSSVVCQQQWTLCPPRAVRNPTILVPRSQRILLSLSEGQSPRAPGPLLQIRIQIRFITLRPAQAVAHLIDWARTLQHHRQRHHPDHVLLLLEGESKAAATASGSLPASCCWTLHPLTAKYLQNERIRTITIEMVNNRTWMWNPPNSGKRIPLSPLLLPLLLVVLIIASDRYK